MSRDIAADRLTIAHDVPGRLRLRVSPGVSTDGLAERVTTVPGVRSAVWSPRTRSLLVLYDADAGDTATIVETVALHTATPQAAIARPPAREPATLAAGMTTLARDLDARVTRLSGGVLTLGALVPLALTAWAARELLRGRTGPLAWSTALWYAHGLFRDYNLAPPGD
jgi:hypothetical protein